jgi:predicted nucleic acid-binding protein
VVAKNVATYEAAAAAISSPRRSVLRVRGYYATVYAVGCLAIRFTILPFTEAELLAAILSCHRDHVALVDNEVAGGPSWTVDTAVAQEFVAAGSARQTMAGAVVPAKLPFERLQRYINHHRGGGLRHGFIDVRSPGLSRMRFKLRRHRALRSNDARAIVYVCEHNGQTEFWFADEWFTEVAGGAAEAATLKEELFGGGLLETYPRREGVSYVVKRRLPDGRRRYFVVVRDKRKKPSALNPTLALAAPVSVVTVAKTIRPYHPR